MKVNHENEAKENSQQETNTSSMCMTQPATISQTEAIPTQVMGTSQNIQIGIGQQHQMQGYPYAHSPFMYPPMLHPLQATLTPQQITKENGKSDVAPVYQQKSLFQPMTNHYPVTPIQYQVVNPHVQFIPAQQSMYPTANAQLYSQYHQQGQLHPANLNHETYYQTHAAVHSQMHNQETQKHSIPAQLIIPTTTNTSTSVSSTSTADNSLTNNKRNMKKRQAPSSQDTMVEYDLSVTEVPKRKRKKKDPNAPIHPRYAWNFFFRTEYNKRNGGDKNGNVDVQRAFSEWNAYFGKKWKNLTPKQRAPYVKLSQLDKTRYEEEWKSYERSKRDPNFTFVKSQSTLQVDEPNNVQAESPTSNDGQETTVLICGKQVRFVEALERKIRKLISKEDAPGVVTSIFDIDEMTDRIVQDPNAYTVVSVTVGNNEVEQCLEKFKLIKEKGYTGILIVILEDSNGTNVHSFYSAGVDIVATRVNKNYVKVFDSLFSGANDK